LPALPSTASGFVDPLPDQSIIQERWAAFACTSRRKERLMPGAEQMFMINGVSICVEVQGDAGDPTVLLIGAPILNWPGELCERLVAGGRRVIQYDVRDTGRSESYPPGKPGYSLADLVEDAVGVLDATATRVAHIVGISTGGWIAQLLALDHPERVATLTLIASRPNTPGPVDADLPEHAESVMEAIRNTPQPDWSDERAVVDHLVLLARTYAGAGAFDEASARENAENTVAGTTNVKSAITNIAFANHGPRWRGRLGEISASALVLHGEDDPFFPIGNGEALAAEIPEARLVRLAHTGHWLPAHAIPAIADELLTHTAG
jgi:pimeloyl-ACP methyl ester carboxylesterase